MSILKPFLTTLLFSIAVCSHAQIITTYAGNEHGYGYNGDGGPATAAKFGTIYTCATDTLGNLFIADMGVNNRIRKVNSSGIVTTVAGNGTYTHSGDSGAATSTGISFAYCVAVDNLENIYIGEGDVSSGLIINSWIRKITPTGVITTIAGNGVGGFSGDNGPATDASFDLIKGLLVDKTGNIYISDQNNFRVRKIDVAGIVTTIAGNGTAVYGGDGGPATAAGIPGPWGLCMDGSGNLYIADAGNSRIRKVNTSGIITTFAGTVPGDSGEGGAATAARISTPYGLAIDKFGSIYFSDLANQKVKKISSSGIITTIAGNGVAGYSGDGGPATSAEIHSPVGVAVDFQGNVFIADYDNNVIRKVSSKNLAIEPVNKSISGKEEVIIKPQPNEGDFVLHIKSEKSQPSNVYIINSIGEIITTMNTLTNMDINMHLKVPAGIYFVKTITANNTHTVQLSIK